MTLTFFPDGTARSLWTDLLPLTGLGNVTVRRASWIDWNEHTQKWEVRFDPHSDKPVFTNASREACLSWEHQQLDK